MVSTTTLILWIIGKVNFWSVVEGGGSGEIKRHSIEKVR